jgi:hypothetical protein
VHSHTGIRSKWRRFNHKYGSNIGIGLIVLLLLALVVLMMWGMNRAR